MLELMCIVPAANIPGGLTKCKNTRVGKLLSEGWVGLFIKGTQT